jgi:hypothetical protein
MKIILKYQKIEFYFLKQTIKIIMINKKGNFKDLTGLKFGKLTVVKILEERTSTNVIQYECLCECGNSCIKTVKYLTRKNKKTPSNCGCDSFIGFKIDYDNPKDKELSLFYTIYKRDIINRSKNKKPTNDILTIQEYINLITKNCFYCGNKGSNTFKDTRYGKEIVLKYNGVDRIDNNRGYEKNNVVSCCKYCNCAKNTMSVIEFRNWVISIYNKFIKKV